MSLHGYGKIVIFRGEVLPFSDQFTVGSVFVKATKAIHVFLCLDSCHQFRKSLSRNNLYNIKTKQVSSSLVL